VRLRQGVRNADAAGLAERHVGGIHRVIRAVGQRHRDIHHGKPERAVLERVEYTLLHRGM